MNRILNAIHNLPEDARRFLAGAIVAVAAVALLISLRSSTSSELADLSGYNGETENSFAPSAQDFPELSPEEKTATGPLAGVLGSVQAGGEFLKDKLNAVAPLPEKKIGTGWNLNWLRSIGRGAKSAASVIATNFGEKTYRYFSSFLSGEGLW